MAKKEDVGSIEAPQYPGLEKYVVNPIQKLSKNPVGQFIAPTALAEYLQKLNYGDPISAGDRGLAALDTMLLDKPAAVGLGALAKGIAAATAILPYKLKASKLAEQLWDTPVIEEAFPWKIGQGQYGPHPIRIRYSPDNTRLYVPLSETKKLEAAQKRAEREFHLAYGDNLSQKLGEEKFRRITGIEDDFMDRWSNLYTTPPQQFKTGEPVTVLGYHGSKRADIERFKKKMLGTNTNANSAQLGTFITGTPHNAANYARTDWMADADDVSGYLSDNSDYLSRLRGIGPKVESKLSNQWDREYPVSNLSRAASRNPDDTRFAREYMQEVDNVYDDSYRDAFLRADVARENLEYAPKFDSAYYEDAAYNMYERTHRPRAVDIGRRDKFVKDYVKAKEREFAAITRQNSKKYKQKDREAQDFLQRADVRLPEYGSSIYPVYTNFQNPLVRNWEGGNYRESSYSKFIQNAIDEGHDGAIMVNTRDPDLDNVFVQLKPHRIRSQFAKFDKSKRKSDDISNAKGGMIERTTRDRVRMI